MRQKTQKRFKWKQEKNAGAGRKRMIHLSVHDIFFERGACDIIKKLRSDMKNVGDKTGITDTLYYWRQL